MTRVPPEYRAIGATTEEWNIEEIAEAIDAMPGAFSSREVPGIPEHVRLILRLLTEFTAAGLLRELDMKPTPQYVRTDVPCAVRETQMHLYRCYDAAGVLLYIGCTSRMVSDRIAVHCRSKEWGPQIARVTEELVIGWRAGLEAERAAITNERPVHNVAHNRQVPA